MKQIKDLKLNEVVEEFEYNYDDNADQVYFAELTVTGLTLDDDEDGTIIKVHCDNYETYIGRPTGTSAKYYQDQITGSVIVLDHDGKIKLLEQLRDELTARANGFSELIEELKGE
jgi:hypothetical protein